jgi:hypothetical protein
LPAKRREEWKYKSEIYRGIEGGVVGCLLPGLPLAAAYSLAPRERINYATRGEAGQEA